MRQLESTFGARFDVASGHRFRALRFREPESPKALIYACVLATRPASCSCHNRTAQSLGVRLRACSLCGRLGCASTRVYALAFGRRRHAQPTKAGGQTNKTQPTRSWRLKATGETASMSGFSSKLKRAAGCTVEFAPSVRLINVTGESQKSPNDERREILQTPIALAGQQFGSTTLVGRWQARPASCTNWDSHSCSS